MKHQTIISAIGIIWLALSSSYIPHLIYYYPFHELKGVKSLTEEVASAPDFIKEAAGINDKTQKELEESLTKELRVTWVKSLLLILVGLLAGVFMLKKKQLWSHNRSFLCHRAVAFEAYLFFWTLGHSEFAKVLDAILQVFPSASNSRYYFYNFMDRDNIFTVPAISGSPVQKAEK